jgi:hypothetical protein
MGRFILCVIVFFFSIPFWFIFPIPFVAPIITLVIIGKIWKR